MTEMANHCVHLVNDCFDQSSSSQECLLQKTNNVSSQLVLSPNETITHSKSLVCIQMGKYFREDRVLTIVFLHYACEIHLSFYTCA